MKMSRVLGAIWFDNTPRQGRNDQQHLIYAVALQPCYHVPNNLCEMAVSALRHTDCCELSQAKLPETKEQERARLMDENAGE